MESLNLGNVLGNLLSESGQEIKFEITCRVVPTNATPANVVQEEQPIEYNPADDIPRPLSLDKQIRGIAQLAKFLRCSLSTAQKLKNKKLIPYYERGTRLFFYEDEIIAALSQNSPATLSFQSLRNVSE